MNATATIAKHEALLLTDREAAEWTPVSSLTLDIPLAPSPLPFAGTTSEGRWGYWSETHVVISPTATRVLFGSDWMNGASVDSYVVDLRRP